MAINLSTYSFNEWLDFIFEHPTGSKFWHFEDEWEYVCDSNRLIDHMTILFNSPEILLDKYHYDKIDQGFWFITGPNGFIWAFLDDKVEWIKRKNCIHSIKKLFSDFYAKHDIGTSGEMWWDSFISYCAYDNKNIETELDILNEVIVVIKEILNQGYDSSIKSAMHGIEHLSKIAKSTASKTVKDMVNKL